MEPVDVKCMQKTFQTRFDHATPLNRCSLVLFFLLAAAWVDPGRSALQSAEHWCKERYGLIHQVGKKSFYDNFMAKTCKGR